MADATFALQQLPRALRQQIINVDPNEIDRPPEGVAKFYKDLKANDDRVAVVVREIGNNAEAFGGSRLLVYITLIGEQPYIVICTDADDFETKKNQLRCARFNKSGFKEKMREETNDALFQIFGTDDEISISDNPSFLEALGRMLSGTHGGGGKVIAAAIMVAKEHIIHIASKTENDGFVAVSNTFTGKLSGPGGLSLVSESELHKDWNLEAILKKTMGRPLYERFNNFWIMPCMPDLKLSYTTVDAVSHALGDELLTKLDVRMVVNVPGKIRDGGGCLVDTWKVSQVCNPDSFDAFNDNDIYDNDLVDWSNCPRVEAPTNRAGRLPLLHDGKDMTFVAQIEDDNGSLIGFEVSVLPRLYAKVIPQPKGGHQKSGRRDRVSVKNPSKGGKPLVTQNMQISSHAQVTILPSAGCRLVNDRLQAQTALRNMEALELIRFITGLDATTDKNNVVQDLSGKEAIFKKWAETEGVKIYPKSQAKQVHEIRPVITHDIVIRPLDANGLSHFGQYNIFFYFPKLFMRAIIKAIKDDLNTNPDYRAFIAMVEDLFVGDMSGLMEFDVDDTGRQPRVSSAKLRPVRDYTQPIGLSESQISEYKRKGIKRYQYTLSQPPQGIITRLAYAEDDPQGRWHEGQRYEGEPIRVGSGWDLDRKETDDGIFYTITRTDTPRTNPETGVVTSTARKVLGFADSETGVRYRIEDVFNDPHFVPKPKDKSNGENDKSNSESEKPESKGTGKGGRHKVISMWRDFGDPSVYARWNEHHQMVELNSGAPMLSEMFRGAKDSPRFKKMEPHYWGIVNRYTKAKDNIEMAVIVGSIEKNPTYPYPESTEDMLDILISHSALDYYVKEVYEAMKDQL